MTSAPSFTYPTLDQDCHPVEPRREVMGELDEIEESIADLDVRVKELIKRLEKASLSRSVISSSKATKEAPKAPICLIANRIFGLRLMVRGISETIYSAERNLQI